ncbi:hypothetical protein KKD52_07795 [Myxococcota bacterium]|nr:hypothetical protein [Myxococcota bacterium]MBU1412289.1 hypothetical protein [Myxococcota bacterium]MBU1510251.1 hypothetical protein [Myxococcota bacterium]
MRHFPACLLLLFLCVHCENAKFNPVTNNQNNQTGNLTLQFVIPASGEVALMAGQRSRVDIRVHDAAGLPVSGARLEFRMVGVAGGTTLASSSAVSDTTGLASLNLIAGASASHFQVRIENTRAVPLQLDVTVSSTGLVRFRVAFNYAGELLPGDIEGLQTGIVFGSSCDMISPYTVVMDRQRTLPSWLTIVEYPELPVDLPFSIVTRGLAGPSEPRIHGCLTPEIRSLIPDATVDVEMQLEDYSRQLPGPWTFETPVVGDAIPQRARYLFASWQSPGNCTYGLAQLYFNCLVSLLESGDLSVCAPGVPTAESEWILEHRGRLDAQGCRNGLDELDRQSLESHLHALLTWETYQGPLAQLDAILNSDDLSRARVMGRLLPEDAALRLEVSSIQWLHDDLWHPVTVSTGTFHSFSCPGTSQSCLLEPFMLSLDWENLLVRHLRESWLDPAGIPPEGSEFAAILLEGALVDAWPETLQERFAGVLGISLPEITWSRTFELLGLQFSNPATFDTGPDCRVEGSLLLPDRDLNFLVDTVIPDLTVSPCVLPCVP